MGVFDHIVSYVSNKIFMTIPVITIADEPSNTMRGIECMENLPSSFYVGSRIATIPYSIIILYLSKQLASLLQKALIKVPAAPVASFNVSSV